MDVTEELRKKVEDALSKVKPSLGGADLRLRDIGRGIVTLEYYRPLSNPSACHVDRTPIDKEIVKEVVEEQLKRIVPDFKRIILLESQ